MNGEEPEPERLRDDPSAREELRERLDRYLDVPLALASLALVLLAVIELTGEVSGPWEGRLATLGWALWGALFRRVRGQVRARAGEATLPARELTRRPDRGAAVLEDPAGGATRAGAICPPAAGLRRKGLAVYHGSPQEP